MIQLFMAGAAFGVLWPSLKFHPKYGVLACLAYLAGLGALRRWAEFHFGVVTNDPLLLVVPAVVFVTALEGQVWQTGPRRDLTRSALAVLVAMLIQALNPLQGAISVGLAGLLFYVVPVLWFFIARKVA